jgi:hypothetical protein
MHVQYKNKQSKYEIYSILLGCSNIVLWFILLCISKCSIITNGIKGLFENEKS